MSEIVDYSRSAEDYDAGRKPFGVGEMLAAMKLRTGKSLEQIRLLDAAGGTGSYAKEFLDAGIGHVTLLDANEGMLGIARRKLSSYLTDAPERISIVHESLPKLPYEDGSFDCVLFGHVFPHLDGQVSSQIPEDHPIAFHSVKEAYRVLKPSGVIIATLTLPQQLQALWWSSLIPKGVARVLSHLVDSDCVIGMLTQSGFVSVETTIKPDQLLFLPEKYFDPEGPLKENVRNLYGAWSHTPEEEFSQAMESMAKMKAAGKLREYMEKHDSNRAKVGQFTIFIAHKEA